MGREIVYCQSCGSKLTETDFERGKAQMIDHSPFCSRCRPIATPPPTPPVPERRGATTTRRKAPTGWIPRVAPPAEPPTRRTESTTRRKKTAIPWLAAGGAALVLVLIAAAVASSGRKPPPSVEPAALSKAPPEPRPSAREGADARLRELEEFAAAVNDPEAILVRCDQLRPTFRESPLEPRFKQVESRAMERLKENNRASELDRSLAAIRKLIQDDPACARRTEVENLLAATLKTAGSRSAEVQKLQEEYKTRCEEAARRPARGWAECFTLAVNRITANDYPGAKVLYLEGLVTLPATRPEELVQRSQYCIGLYNIACIYAVEASKLADAARREAVDQAFKHLDWALRSDYGRFRCPCHPQTGGLGHMGDDKDMEALRGDPRYAALLQKYKP